MKGCFPMGWLWKCAAGYLQPLQPLPSYSIQPSTNTHRKTKAKETCSFIRKQIWSLPAPLFYSNYRPIHWNPWQPMFQTIKRQKRPFKSVMVKVLTVPMGIHREQQSVMDGVQALLNKCKSKCNLAAFTLAKKCKRLHFDSWFQNLFLRISWCFV